MLPVGGWDPDLFWSAVTSFLNQDLVIGALIFVVATNMAALVLRLLGRLGRGL